MATADTKTIHQFDLAEQIQRLARFIEENIPGEPSQSQGAVDTAIRLLTPTPATATRVIDVTFDGPPSHEAGRFVDVHTTDGHGINVGQWIKLDNGYWALRLTIIEAVA